MTKNELKHFNKILYAKQEELEHMLRPRDGIAVERSPDALDQVRNAADLEIRIRSLDRESTILREVRSAIRRIEDGSFGVCVNCEDEIASRRLAAIPWTPLCIHCQQQAECEHQMGTERQEVSSRAA
jgi:DnaK suppressor protein